MPTTNTTTITTTATTTATTTKTNTKTISNTDTIRSGFFGTFWGSNSRKIVKK
jgi:hypothetical protein